MMYEQRQNEIEKGVMPWARTQGKAGGHRDSVLLLILLEQFLRPKQNTSIFERRLL